MQPWVITKSLTAAVANNIALSQSLGAAGALTLNGSTVSGGVAQLDTQRRVAIASTGNDSGITFLVKGTLQSGTAISETVSGTNIGTAYTLQDFYTVTGVTTSGATASSVTVGTSTVGSTPWIPVDNVLVPTQIGFEIEFLDGTGSATATIETTQNDPKMPLYIYQPGWSQTMPVPTPFAAVGMTNIQANAQGTVTGTTIMAWRVTITAGTGRMRTTGIQAGVTQT